MKSTLKGIAIGLFIAACAMIMLWKPSCDNPSVDDLIEHGIVNLTESVFQKPSWLSSLEPDVIKVATIRYKTVPPIAGISGGVIYEDGDIELEFQLDSTLFERRRFDVGGYHGKGMLWIDSLGVPHISYPRFGLDLAGVIGPSARGITVALEHVYINNFLGITHVHPLTPFVDAELWQNDAFDMGEDQDDERDVWLGIGATADLAPSSFHDARIGLGWQWQLNEPNNGPTIFLGISFP